MSEGARRRTGWLLLGWAAMACAGRYDGEPRQNPVESTGTTAGAAATIGTGGTGGHAGKGPKPMGPAKGGAPLDDEPSFSCGEGPGGFGNEGGLIECGGCSAPRFGVRCASGAVFPDDVNSAADACAAVQRAGGEGGAAGADGSGGTALDQGGVSNGADLCSTYVDEPRVTFDDIDCLGSEDEDRVGECVVQGECCVIVMHSYCGV